MDIKVIILVSIAFLNFSLGASIFLHSKRSVTSMWFSLFAFWLGVWSFGMMMYASDQSSWATIFAWSLILHFAGACIALSLLFFSFSYPEDKMPFNKIWQIFFTIPLFIIFYFLFINKQIIVDLKILLESRQLIYGLWYPFYFGYFFIYMGGSLLTLFVKASKIKDLFKKKQVMFVFLGTFFPIVFTGIINMILPAFGDFTYAWVGPIFLLIVLMFIAYAIIKLNFLDIKLISTEIVAILISLVSLIQVFLSASSSEIFIRMIVFIFTLIFSILLIRSVLKEVSRREQMERLARQLSEANKKRARINKQLEKANKQLKKLDEAKSEFISIASHQLRTPLTAIKGYGSMLLEGDFGEIKDSKHKDAIEKMFISNNRLISLVENLLNISRIESGRLRFDFKDQQLEALVEDVFNNFQQSAKNAGLFLKLKKLDKPLSPVYMDDEKIRQVVLNFIDNAIKYTRKGGIVVHLYEKDKQVFCKVEDTGMGVNKEDQKKLFQKFARGKDAFLVNTEGSGLGLYVAQMMIASHKGNIWVESEGMGKGSNFCFSLPVANSVTAKQLKNEQKKQREKDMGNNDIVKKDK